jgi:hypothetical protein
MYGMSDIAASMIVLVTDSCVMVSIVVHDTRMRL